MTVDRDQVRQAIRDLTDEDKPATAFAIVAHLGDGIGPDGVGGRLEELVDHQRVRMGPPVDGRTTYIAVGTDVDDQGRTRAKRMPPLTDFVRSRYRVEVPGERARIDVAGPWWLARRIWTDMGGDAVITDRGNPRDNALSKTLRAASDLLGGLARRLENR